MSYSNPSILEISAPTGLDTAIESLRLSMAGLSWENTAFGRAWEFKEVDPGSGKVIKVPKCYLGEGEYINVLPNDTLKTSSQSFIAVRGMERTIEYNQFSASSMERDVSLIFWMNLKEIDQAKDWIFTEQLKAEVEALIKANPYVSNILAYYDERVEDVFDGYVDGSQGGRYSVEDTKTQYLMYPYTGFRFDLTLAYSQYNVNC